MDKDQGNLLIRIAFIALGVLMYKVIGRPRGVEWLVGKFETLEADIFKQVA